MPSEIGSVLAGESLSRIDERFHGLIAGLPQKLEQLLQMEPVSIPSLPARPLVPSSGIYLLTERDEHLYVGRSRRIRTRLIDHTRPSAGHNMATFAFLLARHATGSLTASYRPEGSRLAMLREPTFAEAFGAAKQRVNQMQVRFVEECHPVRQCLLEVYVATALQAKYNDFDSH